MIKIMSGDLLEATEDIIVHQTNCFGGFGSGIAGQIKEKFPQAYEDYRHLFKDKKRRPELLGDVRVTMIKNDKICKYICHLFSQDSYGYDGRKYTSYDAMYQGLLYIKEQAMNSKKSVALPYMLGCGLGGGSWKIVQAIIEDVFEDYEVTIYKLGEY